MVKVQPTPGSSLAGKLKEGLNPAGAKEQIQVIEEVGLPISAGLKLNDPFRPHKCRFGDNTCLVEPGKDCAKMGVIYEITCRTCNHEIDQGGEESQTRQPGGQQAPNYMGMTMTSAL